MNYVNQKNKKPPHPLEKRKNCAIMIDAKQISYCNMIAVPHQGWSMPFWTQQLFEFGKNADSIQVVVRETYHCLKFVWPQSEFAFFGVCGFGCTHLFLFYQFREDANVKKRHTLLKKEKTVL